VNFSCVQGNADAPASHWSLAGFHATLLLSTLLLVSIIEPRFREILANRGLLYPALEWLSGQADLETHGPIEERPPMIETQAEPSHLRVLLCRKDRGPMGMSCVGGGAEKLMTLMRMGLAARGLTERVTTGWAACFGYCQHGPNARIVGGAFLHGVTPETLEEALDRIEQACRTREADHDSVRTAAKD
jgi:hypothetical protein